MAIADSSSLVVPYFRHHTVLNDARSKAEGRPIYDDLEIVEIRYAADTNKVSVFPAHEVEPNATREAVANGGEPVTYAMLYSKQYAAFRDQQAQDLSGTPLSELPFLTEGRRSELKALNIYTAEALAAVDGQPLKRLGMSGFEMKRQAQAYLEKAAGTADVTALAAKIAALQQQLKEKDELLSNVARASRQHEDDGGQEDGDEEDEGIVPADKPIDECTDGELKAFIKERTGQPVRGNPSRETLVARATEIVQADAGAEA